VIGHQAPVQQVKRMSLMRLDENLLKRKIILRLLKQPQSSGAAVPNMVHITARTLTRDTWHVLQSAIK
jgi:hypothetical protein